MWRVANGANSTGAVSPRVKIGWPEAARESRPSSVDLSRIFSTPITSTTSCTPLATAIAPTRNASEPDGHAFSMRVHGMPTRPIAVGIVLPPMPSWPHSVPALGRDERGLDLVRLEALVDARDRGVERGRGHLLVALVEQLAHLDEAGADDGHPVPRHYVASIAGHAQRPRLESVDRNTPLVRVLPQHELDPAADLDVGAVADHLEHEPGAVVHVEHRDRQRRDERRRHRLVDHVGVHRAAARERDRLELGAAAVDAGRMDRRRRADRAAVDAAPAEQAEHLVGAAHEQRALGRHAHRDGLAAGHELAAGAQQLGVRRRAARRRARPATAVGAAHRCVRRSRARRSCGRRRCRRRRPCPGVSIAPSAPSSAAAAPVSPTAV